MSSATTPVAALASAASSLHHLPPPQERQRLTLTHKHIHTHTPNTHTHTSSFINAAGYLHPRAYVCVRVRDVYRLRLLPPLPLSSPLALPPHLIFRIDLAGCRALPVVPSRTQLVRLAAAEARHTSASLSASVSVCLSGRVRGCECACEPPSSSSAAPLFVLVSIRSLELTPCAASVCVFANVCV